MKKAHQSFRKVFIIILFLLSIFFVGCEQIEEATTQEKVYELDTTNIKDEILIDEFELANIKIIIKNSNGIELATTDVTESMLSTEDLDKLNTVGKHSITINYKTFTKTIEINLIEKNEEIIEDKTDDNQNYYTKIGDILALNLNVGEETTIKYLVKGKISEITNTSYGNMYIESDDGRILIYGLYDEDGKRYDSMNDKPEEGDTIDVEAIVKNYNGELELLNAVIKNITKAENQNDENQTNQFVDANGYYESAKGLSGNELKLALRKIISKNHKSLTYSSLNTYLQTTDASPNNANKILLFYTRKEVSKTWDGGSTWNKEHVWPQSKGWFTTSGAGSDAHHIRAVDSSENSRRGNTPYGTTSGYYEPQDSVKGDVARIIFYLLTRYSEADSYNVTAVAKSMDMLLEWNKLDPVDDIERARNEAVYKIQGNRNPFIDYSDYAYYIWDTSYLSVDFSIETNNIISITKIYVIIDNKKGHKGLFYFQ